MCNEIPSERISGDAHEISLDDKSTKKSTKILYTGLYGRRK